jgi:hypothetical protein
MTVTLTHAFVSGKSDGVDSTLVQPSNWNANHSISMAQGNILGRAAGAGTGAVTEIPLSFDGSNNATFPGQVNLVAGTTAISPLKLQSGTNLTSASAGNVEYDGKVQYFTPIGTQRGIVPGMQFYCLQSPYTFTSSTSVVPIYNVGVTLSASTVYAFEGLFMMIKSSGSTVAGSMGFGGTATVNNILYQTHSVFDAGGIPQVDSSVNMAILNTVSMTPFTISAAVGALTAFFSGTVSINAGGTFIPQYQQSAAGSGTVTNQTGTYFRIYPIGASGSNVSVGTWA